MRLFMYRVSFSAKPNDHTKIHVLIKGDVWALDIAQAGELLYQKGLSVTTHLSERFGQVFDQGEPTITEVTVPTEPRVDMKDPCEIPFAIFEIDPANPAHLPAMARGTINLLEAY